jgi:hypothetical protein
VITAKIFSQKTSHEKKEKGEAELFLESLAIGGLQIDISTRQAGHPEKGVSEELHSWFGLFPFFAISNN